jgi:hypothetical protein
VGGGLTRGLSSSSMLFSALYSILSMASTVSSKVPWEAEILAEIGCGKQVSVKKPGLCAYYQ